MLPANRPWAVTVQDDNEDGLLSVKLVHFDQDLVNVIKQIPGRRWDPKTKIWACPKEQLDFMRQHFHSNNVTMILGAGLNSNSTNSNSGRPANEGVFDTSIVSPCSESLELKSTSCCENLFHTSSQSLVRL